MLDDEVDNQNLRTERRHPATGATPIVIVAGDAVPLGGHLWHANRQAPLASVIINPATGVLAHYYHYYAQFLARHGFDVLTYDYRGIGQSRPECLRGIGYLWRDWGEKDFDAALRFMHGRYPEAPVMVVGHSIGGHLPGQSANAHLISRMLTVGAQYAYWCDYAPDRRARLFVKWHLVMPLLTALFGYFPGKRLGWLEDLPAGVANEWSFRRAKMEMSYPRVERADVLGRFDAVTAPILAVALSDDELGTVPAIRRSLGYYRNAVRREVLMTPERLGFESVGHFGLFHTRHAAGFWLDTLLWLRDGINPWPEQDVQDSG
ncbi:MULTISPECIES: alpha/beta hydrolase family protein [Rhizobium]|uniref:Alpha/beta hydrolase n=1 Tax=Rhizobium favelukesii TaxID=348824 RepID=W6RPV9_9HYPH|nr:MULTISPECIES: alpha/beta fold hydrolase [Rhizobium]MCS0457249.1 alpha/beta fold hydrolase [Rhizobium favelukesii]UFS81954.1 alpha/beta fold hydrolase [Rhizobium sp. T136]CDM56376.1 alpha/beta hydrolase [Rhizobium favelukesii]